MNLNNAQETVNISFPLGYNQFLIGAGIRGEDAMWPSNTMHNNIHPDEKFTDLHMHHLKVNHETTNVVRTDVETRKR